MLKVLISYLLPAVNFGNVSRSPSITVDYNLSWLGERPWRGEWLSSETLVPKLRFLSVPLHPPTHPSPRQGPPARSVDNISVRLIRSLVLSNIWIITEVAISRVRRKLNATLRSGMGKLQDSNNTFCLNRTETLGSDTRDHSLWGIIERPTETERERGERTLLREYLQCSLYTEVMWRVINTGLPILGMEVRAWSCVS